MSAGWAVEAPFRFLRCKRLRQILIMARHSYPGFMMGILPLWPHGCGSHLKNQGYPDRDGRIPDGCDERTFQEMGEVTREPLGFAVWYVVLSVGM